MKKLLFLMMFLALLIGCSEDGSITLLNDEPLSFGKSMLEDLPIKERDPQSILDLTIYPNDSHEWGENVTGVKTKLNTNDQVMALTFDACGGPHGSQFDEKLINYLIENDIPATLFVNKRWIEGNYELFIELAEHPLFQIENHGTNHLPVSIDGKEAWGIKGTNSHEEIVNEVMENHRFITNLTGIEPTLFRSGTAYYDEVAVQIVKDLGFEAVNFDILGDAGGTYSKEQVKQALLSAENGSIALLHMNQPTSGTAEGVIEAIPVLKELGYKFVLLGEYNLK
ncbi:polysaccharide deacetylase family protein [Bacillaceae bacterium W0354]